MQMLPTVDAAPAAADAGANDESSGLGFKPAPPPAAPPALGPALREIGGPTGPEPTRYGDWEKKGRCIDF